MICGMLKQTDLKVNPLSDTYGYLENKVPFQCGVKSDRFEIQPK